MHRNWDKPNTLLLKKLQEKMIVSEGNLKEIELKAENTIQSQIWKVGK